MLRRSLPIGLCVAVAVGGVAVAASGGHGMTPRAALLSAHGLQVRSTVGSFCTESRPKPGGGSAECADYAYPLKTHGRLPVAGGDRVAVRFRHNPTIRDRVRSVRVTPLHATKDDFSTAGTAVRARVNPKHPSRWKATLPGDLGTANVLDVSVRYPHGDADFWAGVVQG
jgi:hypothetical protein